VKQRQSFVVCSGSSVRAMPSRATRLHRGVLVAGENVRPKRGMSPARCLGFACGAGVPTKGNIVFNSERLPRSNLEKSVRRSWGSSGGLRRHANVGGAKAGWAFTIAAGHHGAGKPTCVSVAI
jgi:hypothetical protein